jgi:predicted ester cyclase
MSTEENKAVIRRLADELSKGNLAVAETLIAENHRNPYPAPGQPQGREGTLFGIGRLRAAFPDLSWNIEDMIAEGDKVVQHVTLRGTHQGEFMGIPPTGKQVAWRSIGIDTVVAGQCTETVILMDTLSLLQQLGAIPLLGR